MELLVSLPSHPLYWCQIPWDAWRKGSLSEWETECSESPQCTIHPSPVLAVWLPVLSASSDTAQL